MPQRPLLLFDMDGTLIEIIDHSGEGQTVWHGETYGSVKQRMKDIATAHGVPSGALAGLDRMSHIWNAARAYADRNGFTEEATKALMNAINGPFMEEEKADHGSSTLIPGAEEALAALNEMGFEMTLVTTASRGSVERIMSSPDFGSLGQYFTHMVTRDECNYIKPKPEPIQKALRLHGRDDFIYIGDTDHDAEATKAAGGAFILINTRGFDQEHVERLEAAAVVTSPTELPGELTRLEP